jgi:hypothetical protein
MAAITVTKMMIGDQQMGSVPDFRRTEGRFGVVGLTLAALCMTMTAAFAQPIILAPEDSGRMMPSVADVLDSGGFSNFSSTDMAPPTADLPDATQPVVVEMFTSQGCSSCPPADAMLAMLGNQPDVLPLSYHVDYWDYLGWADSFAKPEFTDRQESYARAVGERSVYTPQIIVGGTDTALSPGPTELMGLVDGRRFSPTTISVTREKTAEGEAIELSPLSELGSQIDIVLVSYAPERRINVTAGENRGRTILYTNVVLATQHLTEWDGVMALRLNVRPEYFEDGRFDADTRHVLLVQQMLGKRGLPGAILTAIRLD